MELLCRSYLYLLSGYHLFTGIISVFFTNFALTFYRTFYSFAPAESQLLRLVLKPWGALAVFAGCAGFVAAQDPYHNSGIIASLAGLLILRLLIRWRNRQQIAALFGIPSGRNWLNMGLMGLGAGILLAWLFDKGGGTW